MAFNLNSGFSGLTTVSVTIPTAGNYTAKGTLTLPMIAKGNTGNSQCVVTITQTPSGGSPTTIYTGPAAAEGFYTPIVAAALDVIAVTTSSAAAVDQNINTIRTSMQIG